MQAKIFRKRSKFDLTHVINLTASFGKLTPILVQEVLPGDTFKISTEMLIRLKPLISPAMSEINAYIHYFFVPNRLTWTNWQQFITGFNDDQSANTSTHPYVTSTAVTGWLEGTLADYFGLPTGIVSVTANALPFRAYNLIYNEWYRDQNLQTTKRVVSLADGSDVTTNVTLATRAWEKDYFTSSLPSPQKGAATYLPLGTTANIRSDAARGSGNNISVLNGGTYQSMGSDAARLYVDATAAAEGNKLYADLTTATAATVNDLRLAFQVQRFFEKAMRGGSRYVEYLRNFFQVISSDARLQRPEYLGGGKSPVIVSEVLQTSSSVAGQTPQGTMAGHGLSAQKTNHFIKSFEEHGFIIGLLSIMPRTQYQNGVRRMWNRPTKFDYFVPELAHLGEQAVFTRELYAACANPTTSIWGYQARFQEYRETPNSVHGAFRSTLNYWHLGRQFAAEPALNSSFITCDASQRIFAEQVTDPFYVQLANIITAIRPLPQYGDPGLIDHSF